MNLTKLREKRAAGENGFTLIELLVVVVIIGILIAIAIPVYLNYKKGASDKSAESDLRNAVSVLEQCNTDNGGYPTGLTAGAGAAATTYIPQPTTGATACTSTVKTSSGTTLVYRPAAGTVPNAYNMFAYNTNGSGSTTKYYCYASAAGGSVAAKTTALPGAYAAACPTT